jgi:hypothetical protein
VRLCLPSRDWRNASIPFWPGRFDPFACSATLLPLVLLVRGKESSSRQIVKNFLRQILLTIFSAIVGEQVLE